MPKEDASAKKDTKDTPDTTNEHGDSQHSPDSVEPGMAVESHGENSIGAKDISKPRVEQVIRDEQGHTQQVEVEKGIVFRKTFTVPADHVTAVDKKTASGTSQERADRSEVYINGDQSSESSESSESGESDQQQPSTPARKRSPLRQVGPGLLAGMSGNDATAVTAYAITGATVGYGQLWLMLLSTPLYQSVIYACGKIGRITQQNFLGVLQRQYGRKLSIPVALLLLVGNVILITGDLIAVGSGLELITGISWVWFVIPVAIVLWYVIVFRSFEKIKRIFLMMSLAFIAYIITGFFSHADWGSVLRGTFIPQLSFSFGDISSAVALLGATLSPYTMIWQAQSEVEQRRPGTLKHQVNLAAIDIASGTIGGNFVAYFIILTTSATLFTHHQQITTAASAARALEPLLGPAAKYLFAIGLIGAGTVAIPVLLASTSYALSGTLGWSASLWKKPWQNEGFYLIITAALVMAVILALLRFNPIQFIFLSNVLQGIVAPVLLVVILLTARSRRIMREHRIGLLTSFWLALAVVITVVAVALLFFGMVRGQ
jgi:NRAMP (natural resistance-associated macrophage protein)-like metal ion transporter